MMEDSEETQVYTFERQTIEGGSLNPLSPYYRHNRTNCSYSHAFCNAVFNFQQSGLYTDYKIQLADGSSVQCHKMVLAIGSPFFKTAFNSGLAKSCEKEMDLSHLDADIVRNIIRFFYLGNLIFHADSIVQVVEAASFLALDDLKKDCERRMLKLLKKSEAVDWFTVGCMFDLKSIVDRCATQWFDKICFCDYFKKLTLEELIDIVKQEKIEVESEDIVLEACIQWTLHDVERRKPFFVEILNEIRINNCSESYIIKAVKQHRNILPALFKSKQSRDKLEKKLRDTLSPRLFQSVKKVLLILTQGQPYFLHPSGKWKYMYQDSKITYDAHMSNNLLKNARCEIFPIKYGFVMKIPTGMTIFDTCTSNSPKAVEFDKSITDSIRCCAADEDHLYVVECASPVKFMLHSVDIKTTKIVHLNDQICSEESLFSSTAIIVGKSLYFLMSGRSGDAYFNRFNIQDRSWTKLAVISFLSGDSLYGYKAYHHEGNIILARIDGMTKCHLYNIDSNTWKEIAGPQDVEMSGAYFHAKNISHFQVNDKIVYVACLNRGYEYKIDKKFALSLKTLQWEKSTMPMPTGVTKVNQAVFVDKAFVDHHDYVHDDRHTYEEAFSPYEQSEVEESEDDEYGRWGSDSEDSYDYW